MQDPLVGREVDGRYLIESRIAHGGMANVYLALDRRLDREIALKVLYEHLSTDDEFVTRFVREARAAARLSHPNAVQVFDQGSDGPVLYLAMEYLPGRTLREALLQRGALTPRETISVMEPVLGALGAAHRAGIVHRDVKPENVILTDDGRIKVADFGLARAVTAPMTGASNGQLIGTVAYLAPELVSRGVADARADVYAAGILLFELLTGKQPFTGDDPLQVAYRHVHENVPRPSEVSAGVTSEFDDLVLRATSRDPDDRPADADEFLAELREVSSLVADEVLDLRAAEAPALRAGAATVVNGAPAPAGAPQATRALAVGEQPRRRAASTGPGMAGLSQLIPRLRVHDDDEPASRGIRFLAGSRNRNLVLGSIAAAVLALLLVVLWYNTSGPGAYIKTPALVGATVKVAQQELAKVGLTGTVSLVPDESVPKGAVISTDPAPGENVRERTSVALTVSKGPDLVAIPDLRGLTVDEAKDLLVKARLDLGDTKTAYSTKVPKDQIIKSSPIQDIQAEPGTKVSVTVSRGEELVQLPSVVGQGVDAAKQQLEGLGLKVEVIEQDPGLGQAPGIVLAQSPEGQNQGVAKGSTVTLSATKKEQLVPIPNVRGWDLDDATDELEERGFTVIVTPFFAPGDTVQNQSLDGQAPPGTTITLDAPRF